MRSWYAAAALLCAAPLGARDAAAQPVVRVRAETRIELRVERREGGAVLHGTLRDDRGDALPDRPVGLRVYPAEGRRVVGRREGRTDPSGRVRADFTLPEDEYVVEADYPGEERYRGVRVEQRLDLARAHVRLGMANEGPGRLDRIDLDQPRHRVVVQAESAAPRGGAGLDVVLRNELREELARGTTDEEGVARFEVDSAALGPPAAGRLVVRTDGDADRAAAQTEVLVVRYRPTALTLAVEPATVREGSPVEVSGILRTREAPLARKAVGLFAEDRHLLTVLTDDEGRFRRELILEATEDGAPASLTARFESDAPWRPDARSAPARVQVRVEGATPWQWLLVSVAVCGVLVLSLSRGRRDAGPEAPEDAPPPEPGIALGTPAARIANERAVAGVVFDADERTALARASVSLEGPTVRRLEVDAAGAFAAAGLEPGRWTLRAEAPGYEPIEAGLTIPHRGEHRGLRIGLRALRVLALRRYRPVAEALRPTPRWWAHWTLRELSARAAGEARDEVQGLTAEVERAAYGPSPPSRDQVGAISSRARRVAADLEAEREEPSTS